MDLFDFALALEQLSLKLIQQHLASEQVTAKQEGGMDRKKYIGIECP